jgi:hypothetical protein
MTALDLIQHRPEARRCPNRQLGTAVFLVAMFSEEKPRALLPEVLFFYPSTDPAMRADEGNAAAYVTFGRKLPSDRQPRL